MSTAPTSPTSSSTAGSSSSPGSRRSAARRPSPPGSSRRPSARRGGSTGDGRRPSTPRHSSRSTPRCPTRHPGSSRTSATGCSGGPSSSSPTGAASCCGSSRWSSAPTTPSSVRRGDAARQHRADPRPLPRQAASDAARRPVVGVVVTTPGGPADDGTGTDGTGIDATAALDDVDAQVLDRLGALHDRLDGPPPGFTDLMVFAVAAHGLEVELARLEEGMAVAARSGEEVARSLTFEATSVSILLRVADAGEDRVRLDGWLAPAVRAVVEVRTPGEDGDRTVEPDEDGRFVVDGLRHGFVQVVVRRGPDEAVGRHPILRAVTRPTPPARAASLHAQGVEANAQMRPLVALRHLRRALSLRRGDRGRGRAAAGAGARHGRAGRVGAGRGAAGLADLDAAEPLLPRAERGTLHGQRGILLRCTGRDDLALDAYGRALRLLDRRPSRRRSPGCGSTGRSCSPSPRTPRPPAPTSRRASTWRARTGSAASRPRPSTTSPCSTTSPATCPHRSAASVRWRRRMPCRRRGCCRSSRSTGPVPSCPPGWSRRPTARWRMPCAGSAGSGWGRTSPRRSWNVRPPRCWPGTPLSPGSRRAARPGCWPGGQPAVGCPGPARRTPGRAGPARWCAGDRWLGEARRCGIRCRHPRSGPARRAGGAGARRACPGGRSGRCSRGTAHHRRGSRDGSGRAVSRRTNAPVAEPSSRWRPSRFATRVAPGQGRGRRGGG